MADDFLDQYLKREPSTMRSARPVVMIVGKRLARPLTDPEANEYEARRRAGNGRMGPGDPDWPIPYYEIRDGKWQLEMLPPRPDGTISPLTLAQERALFEKFGVTVAEWCELNDRSPP